MQTVHLHNIAPLEGIAGYWYLATPYSKYPTGLANAYADACRVAGLLVSKGIKLYCPIAHTHPIAEFGNIEPRNHEIWLPLDKPFMDGAHGLIVCKMPSWEESFGIKVEIETFVKAEKPVMFLTWPVYV